MHDAATKAQISAARPDCSTWLAANAGSGKTRVLTNRVARLLLDGAEPSHILCLTYTKAAASEMQNRLFETLGGWAMLPADPLRKELRKLGVTQDLDDPFLRMARTLFARAIETPGGLRIQTIHSFCAALLRRFPLEAGVSPQFHEMEERAAERLRAEIVDQMASGDNAGLIGQIALHLSETSLPKLLETLVRHREHFESMSEQSIRQAYGLPEAAGPDYPLSVAFCGGEEALCRELAPIMQTGLATDQKMGALLTQVKAPDNAALALLEKALLTKEGTIRARLGTKTPREAHPGLYAQLDDLASRVFDARMARMSLMAARRDEVLCVFAKVFLPAYAQAKMARGWLDFDDLILRARDLLSDPGVADWVLYRLDGGIDHILVDEAQDTSPEQWRVIERLAREISSGSGAHDDRPRTIFVVGDTKQSIYSFQGADPAEFDKMRREFAQQLSQMPVPLATRNLQFSFRSSAPVLELVDATFDGDSAAGFTPDQTHSAFKVNMPGRVDLWPALAPTQAEEDGAWYDPVDQVSKTHHTTILARRIASHIRDLIDKEHPLPVEIGQSGDYEARPVTAGDFLILVRSRGRLFIEIIRAAKQAGLPIAGSDRLKVMSELAVRDILALLRFLATPEDDLSLATALRSPLFGLSEAELFSLARGRFVEGKSKRFLWEELRTNRADDFKQSLVILQELLGQTDFLRPYDLIERILTRHRGRRLLIGRLGPEAEDGINALLSQALIYEQTEIPSLTGFVEWAQADDLEIKRAPDSAGQTLRVMTVHGAKGLEAPIVILPDTAHKPDKIRTPLLRDADGMIWRQGSASLPTRHQTAIDAYKMREAQERARLLYVAMTRAEKWLIVAAAGETGKDTPCWYDKISAGMQRLGAAPMRYEFGDAGVAEGLCFGQSDWSDLPLRRNEPAPAARPAFAPALLAPAPPALPVRETLSPSDLGGAKALAGAAGEDEEVAKMRGSALHMLLEHLASLPGKSREAGAETLMAHMRTDPAYAPLTERLPALADEAQNLLRSPDLAPLFAPGTLAEIPISADIPPLGRIHGVIDRLIIAADHVTAIDFKSNRVEPQTAQDVPEGLLRQMGAYAAALAQIYPDRLIDTALVWTKSARYMALDPQTTRAALARASDQRQLSDSKPINSTSLVVE